MGYMGFGMKKEVYTRKPKKFFSTLKGTYREKKQGKNEGSKHSLTELRAARNNRFKHFHQTILFKAVAIIGIIAFVSFVSWGVYFQPKYFKNKQLKYEREELSQYVKSKASEINEIRDFFNQRNDKLISLAPHYFRKLELIISSVNLNIELPRDSIRVIYSPRHMDNESILITNNHLQIKRDDFIAKTYGSNWILNIDFKTSETLNNSVVNYLESSKSEIQHIVNIIKRNKWGVYKSNSQIQVTYDHPEFGKYHIVLASKKPEFKIVDHYNEKRYTEIGTIEEGRIFWVKWKVQEDNNY